MKRSTKLILTAGLTLGLIGGVAAYGKHRYGDPHKMAEHMVEHVSDELDLNATQAQSLGVLADELLQLKVQMASDLGADRAMLGELITASSFDKGKALAMVNAKTAAIERNAPAVLAALGNFLDALTPEQKAEIAEHLQKRHGHHRRHGHRHDREHGEGSFDADDDKEKS